MPASCCPLTSSMQRDAHVPRGTSRCGWREGAAASDGSIAVRRAEPRPITRSPAKRSVSADSSTCAPSRCAPSQAWGCWGDHRAPGAVGLEKRWARRSLPGQATMRCTWSPWSIRFVGNHWWRCLLHRVPPRVRAQATGWFLLLRQRVPRGSRLLALEGLGPAAFHVERRAALREVPRGTGPGTGPGSQPLAAR